MTDELPANHVTLHGNVVATLVQLPGYPAVLLTFPDHYAGPPILLNLVQAQTLCVALLRIAEDGDG